MAFYAGLRDSESDYHNHKETLGWLAIAAYLIAITELALSDFHGIEPALAVVAGTVAVLAYARRQFNLRMYAAEVVWATARLAALALADDGSDEVAPEALKPAKKEAERRSGPVVRTLLRIRDSTPVRVVFPLRYDNQVINREVLPRAVISELMKKPDRENEIRAESLEHWAYILVVIVGTAALLVLLIR